MHEQYKGIFDIILDVHYHKADVTISYGAAIVIYTQEIPFYVGRESLDAMGRNPLQKVWRSGVYQFMV